MGAMMKTLSYEPYILQYIRGFKCIIQILTNSALCIVLLLTENYSLNLMVLVSK